MDLQNQLNEAQDCSRRLQLLLEELEKAHQLQMTKNGTVITTLESQVSYTMSHALLCVSILLGF